MTAEEQARAQAAHDGGVAITTYFNPMVCADHPPRYGPATDADALTETTPACPTPTATAPTSTTCSSSASTTSSSLPDASSTATPSSKRSATATTAGWRTSASTRRSTRVSNETIDGTRAHNEYAREYHCAAWEAVKDLSRPIVRFQRSGWTGAAKCAQVVWGGDPTTGFGFDGLRSAVTQALSAGTSGIGIWGSDIGGFFALGANQVTPELLTRWVQFGAVSGVMRTQRNGVALPPRDRPQVTDPEQIDNWRRYTKLRTQLYPYISAAEAKYRRSGLPLMRHLLLAYPDDPQAAGGRGRVPLRPGHPGGSRP